MAIALIKAYGMVTRARRERQDRERWILRSAGHKAAAIHYEEVERREGEDWSAAKEYVRSLLHRMT